MSSPPHTTASSTTRNPWGWIPTLYFAQGLPYVVVMTLSVVMYKNLGLSNAEVAFYTSWLYLPWVIKPLWAPLVELVGSKRHWIVLMQFAIGVALGCVALTLPTSHFVQMSLAVLWIMAFLSASHDIAADGFYMLALAQYQQAAFVGVRSTFYRLANIGAQGGVVYLVGELVARGNRMPIAWSIVFVLMAAVFLLLTVLHHRMLPRPSADVLGTGGGSVGAVLRNFGQVFIDFLRKPASLLTICFLLFYRFPEAQLLKLATPFLLDATSAGGLGLDDKALGFAYGTVGLIALTIGGLAGGVCIAHWGLRRMLWPLALSMHVPNVVFVLLAALQPHDIHLISAALALEQFGYGFGFTAYLMYMVWVAEGQHKTAHYALCTGFMALGMMLPGMWSGWLQQQLGYVSFFSWILLCTIPSLVVVALVKIPENFGKKV